MRILVTGANGYLGRCTVHHLQRANRHRVVAAGRKGKEIELSYEDLSGKTDWYKLLRGFDVVVHTAAIVHKHHLSEVDYFKINTEGAAHLAGVASEVGVGLFIQTSTVAVYGDYVGSPFDELDAVNPQSCYAISKSDAEARILALSTKMNRVILRCPMIYGAGAPGNFRRLQMLVNYRLPIPVKGVNNLRSFLSGRSFAMAVERIIDSDITEFAATLNLTEPPVSTENLVSAIAANAGKSPWLISIPPKYKPLLYRVDSIGNIYSQLTADYLVRGDRFQRVFGWNPPADHHVNLQSF